MQDSTTIFERFSQRARKAMTCTWQEAIKLNHDYLGTEHMLLGIAVPYPLVRSFL